MRTLGIQIAHVLLWTTSLQLAVGQQIKPADDAPQPHSPAESLKMFQVEPGFHVEIVAAEPHLADPVALCFDARGQIYACEIHGYNLDGYLDVQELNKTGQLDRQVRRIPAAKWAQEKAEQFTYGTVKLLVDRDGDGRIDDGHVFADQLPPCYGIVPARDGVIVLCAPDIVFLADRDGDGQAEVREKLFTGLNQGELWSRANHLVWGLDNWIYACSGRGPSRTITGPHLKQPVPLGNFNFRFRADGTQFEPATGSAGGFGLGLSDRGDQFLIHNSTNGLQVTPIPYRYQLRNPDFPAPGSFHRAATYDAVYPISQPHPWRAERGRHKAWLDFYGRGEATPNGRFTAACSPTFYRGGAFPDAYDDNLFACESQQNLINRAVIHREGARIALRRPEDFQQREFLASTEGWFRPVNLATGPDGALYVVDMYREIIEDYSAIPRYLQQQYGLITGQDKGRIWRVVWDKAPPPKALQLATASTSDLVKALGHRNAVWRETAQRLLVERGEKSASADLQALVREADFPPTRLHALYTLDGLHALDAPSLLAALRDPHAAVRLHALRLCDPRLNDEPPLKDFVLSMIGDPDPTVRLQLALSLGEIQGDDQASSALAALADKHIDEPWMRDAIMTSVGRSADELLAALIHQHQPGRKPHILLAPLSQMVGSRAKEAGIAQLLTATAEREGQDAADVQIVCLRGLITGLGDRSLQATTPAVRQALSKLLTAPSTPVNLLAYQVAKTLRIEQLPALEQMFEAASRNALNRQRTLEERRSAIQLLSGVSYEKLQAVARQLLSPQQPVELQLEVIDALARTESAEAADLLLAGWRGYSPGVQERALDAIFQRQRRLPVLLDALEKGMVVAASLSSLRRLQLLENSDAALRTRAAKLLARHATSEDQERLLATYRAALSSARDTAQGREVFTKSCAACHRVDHQGFDVGPALSSAMNRPDEALLVEILQPSARITQGYRTYNVVTADGRIFSGVLAGESATSVTLRRDKGAEQTILRKDIEELVAGQTSLMPDDLHKTVTPTDLGNLLSYLREVYGPASPSVHVLFDEDPEFVKLLPDGSGQATVLSADAFAGEHCLSVTPPQKYGARISGWSFPIVEHPSVGQYRYLRVAWRCEKGDGVMLELAADGRWPDSRSAPGRYYSGRNSTAWKAIQVSPDKPTEWTVVTLDLWKDRGNFTLTGIAPTAMGGECRFDRLQLLRTLDDL